MFNLKEWRKSINATQSMAADVLDISRKSYGDLECGTSKFNKRTFLACLYIKQDFDRTAIQMNNIANPHFMNDLVSETGIPISSFNQPESLGNVILKPYTKDQLNSWCNLLRSHGLSKADAAQGIGIAIQSLNRLLKGDSTITLTRTLSCLYIKNHILEYKTLFHSLRD